VWCDSDNFAFEALMEDKDEEEMGAGCKDR
jgi:hypothetical protein